MFITKWGEFGTAEGQFNLPYAVRAGPNGSVYVADSNNHRVQKFQFVDASVPTSSQWGMFTMALLLLTAGTVLLRRRVASVVLHADCISSEPRP